MDEKLRQKKKGSQIKKAAAAALTPESFKQAMQGARKVFASKGIKSKADAFQLINQGFAEKRFNEADARALQMATSLVFDDNSFGLAQTLMNAREKGLSLAAQKKAAQKAPKQAPAKPDMSPERQAAYDAELKAQAEESPGGASVDDQDASSELISDGRGNWVNKDRQTPTPSPTPSFGDKLAGGIQKALGSMPTAPRDANTEYVSEGAE